MLTDIGEIFSHIYTHEIFAGVTEFVHLCKILLWVGNWIIDSPLEEENGALVGIPSA